MINLSFHSRRNLRSLAVSLLLAGSASIQAGDPAKTRDLPVNELPWKFIDGAEFPGATGSVSDGTTNDRETIEVNYDFSGGGEYVEIEFAETVPEGFTEFRFEARSDRDQTLVVRLIDDTEQTHQYRVPFTKPSEWQNLRVDFSEPATDYFFGAEDGIIHYPIKAIGFCVLVSATNREEAGKVEFSRLQLVK